MKMRWNTSPSIFADAGPENEQAVIKELGTPKQAAAELMRNLLDKKSR